MRLNILECHVSKMVNSDTCPSPTTDRAVGAGRAAGAADLGSGRIVASETAAPSMFANLVQSG